MAALAHEHAARLHATEQVHQAVRNGANAAERIRIEQEQDAIPYTSREEAQETSRNIQLVAARWARTATSHQMRTSYAEHDDVRQLRALWSKIARNDLDDGPRPAAARYDGLARAVGELAQRLQTDTAALQQVAEFSRRHSGRLAATEHERAQAASPEPTRHIDSSPPHLRHRGPAFTTGAER